MPRRRPQRAAAPAAAALLTVLRLVCGRAPLPVVAGVVLLAAAVAWLGSGPLGSGPPESGRAPLPGGVGGPVASADTDTDARARPPVAAGASRGAARGGSSLAQLARRAGLRPLRGDAFVSPAGLRYRRGSRHGHRLRHVQFHTRDAPDRPHKHGVFAPGGLPNAVAVIDEAYRLAGRGRHDHARREGGRTVYRVDLGRRVGYLGGRWGATHGNPPCERVQLVLEGKDLITAYPFD